MSDQDSRPQPSPCCPIDRTNLARVPPNRSQARPTGTGAGAGRGAVATAPGLRTDAKALRLPNGDADDSVESGDRTPDELPERHRENRPSAEAADRALVRKPQIGDSMPAPPSPPAATGSAQAGRRRRRRRPAPAASADGAGAVGAAAVVAAAAVAAAGPRRSRRSPATSRRSSSTPRRSSCARAASARAGRSVAT